MSIDNAPDVLLHGANAKLPPCHASALSLKCSGPRNVALWRGSWVISYLCCSTIHHMLVLLISGQAVGKTAKGTPEMSSIAVVQARALLQIHQTTTNTLIRSGSID